MTKTTKENLRAISSIVSGTIGVGFFAIPYSMHAFGPIAGVGLMCIVGFLMVLLNIVFSEIITFDKGNHQIPGYARKYIGRSFSHITTIIIVSGLLGVLLAYSILAGNSLKLLLDSLGVNVRLGILSMIFLLVAVGISRFGMQVLSRISEWTILIMLGLMMIIIFIALPEVSFENVTTVNVSEISLLFGVSIFSLYSISTIPAVDEIIGYDSKRYRKVVTFSTLITLGIYIVFGLVSALSFGEELTSDFIICFCRKHSSAVLLVALFTLFAIFSSFVSITNTIKEVFNYDYKIPVNTALLFITGVLVWLIALQIGDFESIVSIVGNTALALQSIIIFIIWFKLKKKHSNRMKLLVVGSAVALVLGMIIQF